MLVAKFNSGRRPNDPRPLKRPRPASQSEGGEIELNVVEGVRRVGHGAAVCDLCEVHLQAGRLALLRHGRTKTHRERVLRLKTNGEAR